ncbi:hypothetical protein B0H13DRAFT_2090179 [Mycena leptocephala]|nr:hypothetical protein B0H13DRAFT_2090179 [Mycena leptocephala]
MVRRRASSMPARKSASEGAGGAVPALALARARRCLMVRSCESRVACSAETAFSTVMVRVRLSLMASPIATPLAPSLLKPSTRDGTAYESVEVRGARVRASAASDWNPRSWAWKPASASAVSFLFLSISSWRPAVPTASVSRAIRLALCSGAP